MSQPGRDPGTGLGPLVTCVVTAYNVASFVGDAIESILAQTYRPIEVVVATGGSTDGTGEVAEAYGEQVRVVYQDEPGGEAPRDLGPPATRNLGLAAARGEFVAFLDGDDLWHPSKLALQMARFDARPELQCSVTHIRNYWTLDHAAEEARYRDHPRMQPVPGYATGTLLARRSLFDRVGALDSDLWFADATDWFLRVREQGIEIELLPDVLTFRRLHGQNITLRRPADSIDEYLTLLKSRLDRRRARSAGQ